MRNKNEIISIILLQITLLMIY